MPEFSEAIVSPADVENQFYRALATGDLELLMACWAEEDEVSCVPPGGELLRGLVAIRQLFTDLFQRGAVKVTIQEVHESAGVMHAVHTLLEEIEVSVDGGQAIAQVYATNVFVKTPQGWRLQAHHASPGRVIASSQESMQKTTHTLH